MGLIFRKVHRLDGNTRATVSGRGASVSRRFGPFTVSSRGRITLRLAPGLSFRIR